MKKILALVLAMMMVVALCACGSEEAAPAGEEVEEVVEEVAAAVEEAAAPAEDAGEASGEMGDASGEMASGEMASASGEASAEKLNSTADYEITVGDVTDTAHYEDTDNGDEATKSFSITWQDVVITGYIDKGVWTADSGDAADQEVIDAVQAAFEGNNTVGPQA